MDAQELAFTFKARYYKSGKWDATTHEVWIVLHGFGQLARFFIQKFDTVATQSIAILAPEALSRFYLSELTAQGRKDNKVGATWMTSENRLMDIDNYVRFLDALFEKEVQPYAHLPITVLGFSQGCATACRWAQQGRKIKFDKLVLWAGIFPPDMDFSAGHEALRSKKTFLVAGDQDPYLTVDRLKEFDQLASRLEIRPEKIIFNGGHEINETVFPRLRGLPA